MKTCANKECLVELTAVNCYTKSSGQLRSYCKVCHNKNSNKYNKVSNKKTERKDKINKRLRADRFKPTRLVQIIWQDTRKSDAKHNRSNDLTKEFIRGCIQQCCSYCGENKLRMTLDRIDNNKGHIQSNILPACIRCNYARGSMPYEAWILLAPGLKQAREAGLFGEWTGRCR